MRPKIMNNQNNALGKAIDLYDNKKYIKAKIEFLKIAQYGSNFEQVEANLYLGKIALRSDSEYFFDAQNYMDYVIINGNNRQKEQAYFELANKHRISNRSEEAIVCYKECLKIYPNDLYVLTDLANLYFKLDRLKEAEELYYKLLNASKLVKSPARKIMGENTAYLGLARINLCRGDIKNFWFFLDKVVITCKNDREKKKELVGNLLFKYEKFAEAIPRFYESKTSGSFFIREHSKEKIAVLEALTGDNKKSKTTLNRNYPEKPITKAGSATLANIYRQENNYKEAYQLYYCLGFDNPNYFLYALECAMYFDEVLAIKIINILALTEIETSKYMPYVLYLSKKYNIVFADTCYTNMTSVDLEFIDHDEKRVVNSAINNNQLNYRGGYTWDYIFNGIIKNSLANADVNTNVTYLSDSLYDIYIIHVPYVAWDYRDYIVVKTFKGTKTPVVVTMQSKSEIDQATPVYQLKKDENVRKMFR